MNENENLILQGLKLEMTTLTAEIQKLTARALPPAAAVTMPEWVTIELASQLKGGPSLSTLQTRLFLQPCCGLNHKYIGGRKCWRRDDVIRWLGIADADLKSYAQEWGVEIPEIYKRRSA